MAGESRRHGLDQESERITFVSELESTERQDRAFVLELSPRLSVEEVRSSKVRIEALM